MKRLTFFERLALKFLLPRLRELVDDTEQFVLHEEDRINDHMSHTMCQGAARLAEEIHYKLDILSDEETE